MEEKPFRIKAPIITYYKLGRQIGQGAHSKVLLGSSNRTGERVAIKILEKKLQSDQYLSRYIKEIQMMKSLQCPYILRVYEYFEDEERIYVIM